MKKILLAVVLVGFATLFIAAASRRQITVEGNTMVQYGTCTTVANGTVTQTFATAFSSVPVIVSTQRGVGGSATNFYVATTSNFVLTTSVGTQSNTWIAVGTP